MIEKTYTQDKSKFSYLAIQDAITLAQKHNGNLILFHVENSSENSGEKIKKILPHMAWNGVSYEFHIEKGDIVEKVLETSQNYKSPLIVMGTMGKEHVYDTTPQYSHAEIIIQKSLCSVYVLYPQPG